MSFLAALASSLVLTPAGRALGTAVGVVDRPGEDDLKIHGTTVSVLGGAAVVVAALGTRLLLGGPVLGWVLGAAGLALVTGSVDDVRPLPSWARVLLQGAAAGLLVAGGARLSPLGPAGGAGVVLLVVACANAVNIVDGQDGLAGGLVAVAALGFAGAGAAAGVAPGLALALAGGAVGFLAWNLSPARVFLGNGGTYAAGTLLALLAARTTARAGWGGLLAAGLILGAFAFEVLFSVARRLRARAPVTGGDRLHSYDLLSRRTSRLRVTVLSWAVGAALAGAGVLVIRLPLAAAAASVGVVAVVALGGGVALWALLPPGPRGGGLAPRDSRPTLGR